jgi:hypothetical protein
MVWPFERKYSRKLERISLDFIRSFYCSAAKNPERRGRPGKSPLKLGGLRRFFMR